MGSVAKWLGILVVGVIAIALIAVLVLAANLNGAVKTAVERFGPDFTGVPVTLEEVDLSPMTGRGDLRGLAIGNPAGYDAGRAFSLGSIRVAVDRETVLEDVIVIRRIAIDGARIDAILRGRGESNLQRILRNVQAAAGSSEDDAGGDAEAGPRLVIEQLDFTNASASVSAPGLGERELRIPDLHLEGIGRRSNGVTAAEAASQVLQPVVAAIIRAAAEGGIRDALEGGAGDLQERIEGGARGALDRLRGNLDALRPRTD
jgi:hypothetical protein